MLVEVRWKQSIITMKTVIFLCLILGSSLALPTSETPIDWAKIQPKHVLVEPLETAPVPDYTGSRVVGGTTAAVGAFPYQAAVIINGSGFCGGSLISTRWVLTAAHCTSGASYFQIVLGAHNIQSTESNQQSFTSRSWVQHSGYSSSTLNNDISVIQLPSAATLNSYVQTVSLAPASSGTFAGSSATLSGWGRTSDSSSSISSTLQRVTLSVITNAVCQQTFGSSLVVSSTICTSGSGGVGACNGDSGGPLVVSGAQVGIVSYGSSRGCQAGLPSAYGRVSSFRSWISTQTGV